jgi:hypothetical protein
MIAECRALPSTSERCRIRARRGRGPFTCISESTSCCAELGVVRVLGDVCALPLGDLSFHFGIYGAVESPSASGAFLAGQGEGVSDLGRAIVLFLRRFVVCLLRVGWLLVGGEAGWWNGGRWRAQLPWLEAEC